MPRVTKKTKNLTQGQFGTINPLPTWFRIDRDNLAHLEQLIYDKDGELKTVVFNDFANVSKWLEDSLCNPRSKGTFLESLCAERGTMTLWEYVTKVKLYDQGESRHTVIYFLHELKMEMTKRMIRYLLEKRTQMDIKDWYILVAYFFDRHKKLRSYSPSSLEMHMPDDLFDILLKAEFKLDMALRYAALFYDAMRWFTLNRQGFNKNFRERNESSLESFEVEGRSIYNKMHRIKSIRKKFYSYVRRKDRDLYASLLGWTK